MSRSQDIIQKVWEKAAVVKNIDPGMWRKDRYGAWISRYPYGNRTSQYGWEIEHITPVSAAGGDELANLRPLQWENNAGKHVGRLVCRVTAWRTKNVLIKIKNNNPPTWHNPIIPVTSGAGLRARRLYPK